MILTEMGEKMSYQSEAELERQFIHQITYLRHERVQISNEVELLANFRTQLCRHNEKALQGMLLSDKELSYAF